MLSFELLQEVDEFDLEVAVLELPIAPDVHVADEEVLCWHRAHSFAFVSVTLWGVPVQTMHEGGRRSSGPGIE
jgi:hypothetical protein